MSYGIRDDLKKYIKELINYHYNLNDKGHGVEHAEYVINRSLKFANEINDINYEMVYVIAASAQMLIKDEKLKKYFTDEQRKIMSEAVEDHRSSLETEPRSIYGKIVSSADRNTSVEVTLKRCYSYNKKHSQNLMENEVIEKCRRFLLEKFGEDGYARSKMYFDDKEYEKYLYDITELALNSEKFSMEIKRVNGI